MLKRAFDYAASFFKANLMFGLGMIVGSVIGTVTTVMITMGYYGSAETLGMYTQSICGG